MDRKKQMLYIIRKGIAAVLLAALFTADCGAAARISLTPAQEQQVGWGQIRGAGVAYLEVSPALALIQDTLIRWNPGRLVLYKDDNHRGLRPPHLLYTNKSRVNAFSVPGGHIFVSDALVTAFLARDFDPYTGVPSGMQKEGQFGNGHELYGHSALAAALAHEASHWERNFLQQETDTITAHINEVQGEELRRKLQSGDGKGFNDKLDELGFTGKVFPSVKQFMYQEELAADRGAMELLDNTDVYSPGSLMTVTSRLRDAVDTPGKIVHPVASVRKKQLIEHIRQLSQGRVQLDEAGRMKLDGRLFHGSGYLPARADVSAYDRTAYVAGQLAKSIHYNARRIAPLDDEHTVSSSGNMIPLVAVCDDDTRRRFVIDKFAITRAQAGALAAGQKAGHDHEGKAAQEIADFLRIGHSKERG